MEEMIKLAGGIALIPLEEHIDTNRGGTLIPLELDKQTNGEFRAARRFYRIVPYPPITKQRGGHHHH